MQTPPNVLKVGFGMLRGSHKRIRSWKNTMITVSMAQRNRFLGERFPFVGAAICPVWQQHFPGCVKVFRESVVSPQLTLGLCPVGKMSRLMHLQRAAPLSYTFTEFFWEECFTRIHSFQGRNPMSTIRKPYATDLTDAEWSILQPLLKLPTGGRPKTTNLREVINAIRYRHKTGCQWSRKIGLIKQTRKNLHKSPKK